VYDAAARMFWRNLRARASAAPMRALGADPAAYDLPPAADPGPLAAHLPEARAGQTYPAVHGMTYGVTHVTAPPVRPGQTELLMSSFLRAEAAACAGADAAQAAPGCQDGHAGGARRAAGGRRDGRAAPPCPAPQAR